MDLLGAELARRGEAVQRAVANLQARGVCPRPAVLALYARYVRGELSDAQVQAVMRQRATALLLATQQGQLVRLSARPVAQPAFLPQPVPPYVA